MGKLIPEQPINIMVSGSDGTDKINNENLQLLMDIDEPESNAWSLAAINAIHDLAQISDVGYMKVKDLPLAQLLKFADKLQEIDKRTLFHGSIIKKLVKVVDVHGNKEGEIEEQQTWPSYASEVFDKIVENVLGLENSFDDKSQILYHIMEMETLLGRVEEKARVTNRKYEARLAASLRDICRVHEPTDISEEQIKHFADCIRALIEGWGKLNREKVRWIRNSLLEVGLTWLPVTDKATKDIPVAKSLNE